MVTFYKVFGEMMGLAGFGKLKRPSAVNRSYCLTTMNTATTRISGGHLITMDSVSVRKTVTMWPESTNQTATKYTVLRSSNVVVC